MQRPTVPDEQLPRPPVNHPGAPPVLTYPQYITPGHPPMTNHPHTYPISQPPGPHFPPSHNPALSQPPPTSTPRVAQARDHRGSISSQVTGDSSQPTWADLKTKAGKDRKRLPLACIACRRKKIRCSGEKPACKHCLKSRTPCVYKVSTRKAGPRTDYMAMLDKRLKRMEERVIKIIPKNGYQTLPDVSRGVVRPTQAQRQSKPSETKKRTADEAFMNNLDIWDVKKPSSNVDGVGSRFPRPKDGQNEMNLLAEGRECLPSPELQEHLAHTYFDYVYGQSYHLLHKPSFMRKLSAGTHPPVLVLAVCAVSARFSNHPDLKSETDTPFLRGEKWSDAAREIAQRRFDYPSVTILIVMLLLGLHEFGTCQGGRSWMLGGMAVRMAYALQLHKDSRWDPCAPEKSELSITDLEIRRRTMWACFLMDRFNSSGTSRPMFASEDSLTLQLPLREKLFEQDLDGRTERLLPPDKDTDLNPDSEAEVDRLQAQENMGVAAYMIRIIGIWGRIIQYMNLGGRDRDHHPPWSAESGLQLLQQEVNGFVKSLPDALQYSEENLKIHEADYAANQFLYLHIVVHQCLLFLNRKAAPTTAGKSDAPKERALELTQDFEDCRSKALQAAASISSLLERAKEHHVVAPFTGFCAYMSSTVQIQAAFSRNKETETRAKKNLKTNVEYLYYMRQFWGNLYFLSDNLKDTYKHVADLARQGTVTPTPAVNLEPQYGDWYDRYPHGVSREDRQEPVGPIKEEGDDAAMGGKEKWQSVDQYIAAQSPSSKAQQLAGRGGDRKSGRNGKRSRRTAASKDLPSRSSQPPSGPQAMAPPAEASFDSMDLREPTNGFPESYDRSPIVPQQLEVPKIAQNQHDQATSPVANSYALNQMPSSYFMPQNDQMLGFPPYGFMDTGGGGMQDMSHHLWSYDMNTLNPEYFNGEPPNSWFTPFNVSPPEFTGTNDSFMSEPQIMMGQQDSHLQPQDQTADQNRNQMAEMAMAHQGMNQHGS